MTTAEDIEKAVEQLAPQELARFRAWLEAFDAQQFDTAIERDARAGKLDAYADEALAAHRAGCSRELCSISLLPNSGPLTRPCRFRFESWPTPITRSSSAIHAIRRCNSRRSDVTGPYASASAIALAAEVDDGYLWFWMGSHADYDKMIG
jgi:hypothetical protein